MYACVGWRLWCRGFVFVSLLWSFICMCMCVCVCVFVACALLCFFTYVHVSVHASFSPIYLLSYNNSRESSSSLSLLLSALSPSSSHPFSISLRVHERVCIFKAACTVCSWSKRSLPHDWRAHTRQARAPAQVLPYTLFKAPPPDTP